MCIIHRRHPIDLRSSECDTQATSSRRWSHSPCRFPQSCYKAGMLCGPIFHLHFSIIHLYVQAFHSTYSVACRCSILIPYLTSTSFVAVGVQLPQHCSVPLLCSYPLCRSLDLSHLCCGSTYSIRTRQRVYITRPLTRSKLVIGAYQHTFSTYMSL